MLHMQGLGLQNQNECFSKKMLKKKMENIYVKQTG